MLTLGIMCVGVVVGLWLFPPRLKKWNERVQLLCTALLIFSMGVGLGSRPAFLQEMTSLGKDSLIFALVPIALSVVVVYLLSRRFLDKKE